ncbi:GspE/PulE family protein [Oligoflexus tunisiensis]|uniref:GspE/PulE family protein n=1 Tax=Oligoflexus tunisiensis TaxID=708132 RepID=UPI000AE113A7|nr:ATPase, T2SS/T4P/T4SS family [Oligoflexus tunisiensis]
MLRQFHDIAINQLRVDPKTMAEAEVLARTKNVLLVHALIRLKAADSNKLLAAWAHCHKLQIADLDAMDIPADIIQLIQDQVARQARAIPIDRVGNNIIVAVENPHDLNTINLLQLKTGYSLKTVLASEEKIVKALARYYPQRGLELDKYTKSNATQLRNKPLESRLVIDESSSADDGPVNDLINRIMMVCLQRGASDIHVEPYENYMRVRLRIDGALQEIARPPAHMKAAMASRLKVMAGLKIEEKRLPQDGQISVTIEGRPIDFRINTLPTWHGEKVVLRILDKSSLQVDMTKLGFEADDLRRFKDSIHKPYGMVFVTGPTGSGKTTTLYSALAELNQVSDNIMTAEDPVEFTLDGINQVHIRAEFGLTFADALKAFLRQDPDIIMVGEVRDRETGEIAIKAALTGHMVLSTLHTNSAADTIVRLQNMGLESFNLISALQCVVAQRLARRICANCKILDTSIKPDYLVSLGVPRDVAATAKVHKGKGCELCGGTGMKGRVAIHEVMVMNDELRAAIMRTAPAMELKAIGMRHGMRTLRQNGLIKMLRGEMDALEVVSNTAADDEAEQSGYHAA